jgi:hypothetical protein
MKRLFTIFLALVIFGLSGNSVYARKVKALSQLERREVETRFYDTADTMKVMKAAANTLQDSGFVIQEIEPELGYMRAQKTFKKRFMNKGRVVGQSFLLALYTTYTVFTYGSTAYYMVDPSRKLANEIQEKTVVVDSNVNVEKFGKNKTKVRFVLVEKVLQNADGYSYVKSAPARIIRIYKPEVYQEFFAQLDKSIFYEGI